MAAMTTALTSFSTLGNSRTSTLSTHTALKPRLVIEKRRVPEGNQVMLEYAFKVVFATEDVDGLVIANKVSFEVIVRYPTSGDFTDVTAALAIVKDIVGGDEFAASIASLNFL